MSFEDIISSPLLTIHAHFSFQLYYFQLTHPCQELCHKQWLFPDGMDTCGAGMAKEAMLYPAAGKILRMGYIK